MPYMSPELAPKAKVIAQMQHSMYASVHQAYLGYGFDMSARMEEIKAINHAS